MDLVGDESRAFWGAAAQIVPILALALVIETRFIAGRWRKKKFKKNRKSRWFLGIAYSLVVVPLPNVLMLSLANTAEESTSGIGSLLVSLWIGAAIFLVAYIPAWRLLSVALTDLLQLLGDMFPWSAINTLRRTVRQGDILHAEAIRFVRGRRISSLMALADVYIGIIPLEIKNDRHGWTTEQRIQSQSNHAILAQIWKHDAEFRRAIAKFEKQRRAGNGLVDAEIIERNKVALKHMNRVTTDLLAGISG
ncbi:hypothetical protein [Cryobacterium sp. TMS1-13-1]|uniref:hypothetical protein n=1 Tax=Cryobacterium sp. TMS1-13-1 TaxID=1259220 RepID=UPI001069D2AA|nr:hypothetical protein [Cryobacterium sp. TMS1-13-1]TFD19108.1 hypothetical protein E3T31_16070 [Cryobacterium sp. TMS1-13-1]